MAQDMTHYRNNLAGSAALHDGDPQPGYYWMRRERNGQRLPVVIREVEGEMLAYVGDGRGGMRKQDAAELWTWVADKPVSKEACQHAMKTGAWPGDIQWPQIGDNGGPELEDQITEAVGMAAQFLSETPAITTQEQLDRAANLRNLCTELKAKAEAAHKDEKAPHLEAGRAVDAKWKPVIASCDDTAKSLRRVATAYMVAEDAKRHAEAEKARAALAAVSEEEGVTISVEPQKVMAGGQRGKRMGLKTITTYVVEDYDAVLAAVKDRPEIREAVEKAGRTLMKAGVAVPGMKTVESKEAA